MANASFLWEQGSDFHHVSEYAGRFEAPWGEQGQLYLSGRPALNALLEYLRKKLEIRNIWLPAYYCDQVVYPLLDRGFACTYYDGSPETGWSIDLGALQRGDVLIANSFFGIDLLPAATLGQVQEMGVIVIEDHSHDPFGVLAWNSRAEYCFASLRKTLPFPDGGVLWSPQRRSLPEPVAIQAPVSTERVAAMLAKRAYLRAEFSDKALFRSWYAASEHAIDHAPIAAMSVYSQRLAEAFDVGAWRQARARNHRLLCTLVTHPTLKLLHLDLSDLAPMGLIVLCPDHSSREDLKTHLISRSIYPAVLWPLVPGMPPAHSERARDFASRMLFIHCDGRYQDEDMRRVADALNGWTPRTAVSDALQVRR